jgi:hypothetical protein
MGFNSTFKGLNEDTTPRPHYQARNKVTQPFLVQNIISRIYNSGSNYRGS